MGTRIHYVEPVYVPEVFVSGIAYIEEAAPDVLRFVYYSEQSSPLDMSAERHVVARLLIHKRALKACIKDALESTGARAWVARW